MRRFVAFMVLSIAVSAVSASSVAAQEAGGGRRGGAPAGPPGPVPHLPDGRPDLQGVFSGSKGDFSNSVLIEEHPGGFGVTAGPTLILDPPDGKVPYQEWALQERDRRRDDSNGYEDVVGHCEFYDIGRQHTFPMEFYYASDGNVILSQSQHTTRVIDMKRKQHLPDGIRLWLGDSIGHWEGDTLVIDTTNFSGRTRLAIGGDFYSRNAHIVERFQMLDSNTLKWTMTVTDATVFTRPWTMTSQVPMARQRPNVNFDAEDTCHEGNVDLAHLKNVYIQSRGEKESWVK